MEPEPREDHRAEIALAIGGMSCAACARRIERKLQAVEGVAAAVVNLAVEQAQVEYDPSRVRVRDLRQAVEEAGYRVVEQEGVDRWARKQAELRDQRRSLVAAAAFALPLLFLEMGGMLGMPLPEALSAEAHARMVGLLQLLLVLPVMGIAWRVYAEGLRALFRGGPNMFSLIAIGTLAAFGYSLHGLARVALGGAGAFHTYFPAVSTILSLMLLGRYLEARSRGRAGEAIRALMDLQPQTACLVVEAGERQILVSEVEVGDVLRVRPGERVPADGEVVAGHSAVDESLLTGESLPVPKGPGDLVIGGSINREGLLEVRARRVGRDTVLAQIVRLVEQAQQGRAPIARLADAISGYFVPAVILIGVIAAAAWLLAGATVAFALEVFVAVLIIACPCSLGLATPAAIMVGTGRGARLGILVKSPEALEQIHRLDTIALDKTGTITQGRPALTEVRAFGDSSEEEVLGWAAAVEQGSEHPLAAALVEAAKARGLELAPVADFAAVPGQGARARLGNRQVLVGSRGLMEAEGVAGLEEHQELASGLAGQGRTLVWVAVDNQLQGLAALADVPRATSAADIAGLKKAGLEVVMVTGDNRGTAEAVAGQVGIERVFAEVLPAHKAQVVRSLQEEGRRVGMVGDGVNDAPALVQADVGIAIAAGADVAVESADLVLMHDRLSDVLRAIRLSRAVMRTIRQNLFWAFFYNAVGIPVAAGVLYLFGGPLLNPMLASLAMAFSSVSVVGNALRLRRFEPE